MLLCIHMWVFLCVTITTKERAMYLRGNEGVWDELDGENAVIIF